jgi:hypothetical protein
MWVPAHTEVKENEETDEAAKNISNKKWKPLIKSSKRTGLEGHEKNV